MMKHAKIRSLSGALLLAGLVSAAVAAETDRQRTIVFTEDRGQHYMTSKTYRLNHVKAHDLMPYVLGAVKRFDSQSDVQSLDYLGKEQYLVVSTSDTLLPYIDDMIAKLDYPSAKVDENGIGIEGDGIYRWVYCPLFRSSENMREVLSLAFRPGGYGSGASFFDAPTNMFYWKSSKSQGEEYLKFLKAIDRPVPQMTVTLNVYMVSDNDFRELGIDYVAWKNGPGAELFATGFDFTDFDSLSKIRDFTSILSEGPLSAATGWGGIMVAPNFDATFLRMLAQKGKAYTAGSAAITVVNDFTSPAATGWDDASYRFKFVPQFQNIRKDEEQTTTIEAVDGAEYAFYLSMPVICFGEDPADRALTLMCEWNLAVNSLVETDDLGVTTIDSNTFGSMLTLENRAEKLIASFDKEIEVEQYNGMPFFGDIPVLKYLFGAESRVKSKMKIFVTMKAEAVENGSVVPPAAGEVIEAAKLAAVK
ncbi:hypothetical protein [Victivallis lenta]|uniref:hypothetical protein n=1 Tax=Victivallis lenta TaxID=2606640 RepID=UPI001DA81317|nr:hypothetical protein [Lentisphaeria bacterium]